MFLAVDSSLGTTVAIVTDDGRVLSETQSLDIRGHAENIGVLLASALESAGIRASEVTQVVMGIGPGPFTGLRVGMASAIAFAHSRSLPVLPVISHDALGWFAPDDVVVTSDARRGELAYSVYARREAMRRVVGPTLCRPEDLDEALGDYARLDRLEATIIPAAGLAQVARAFLEHSLAFPEPRPQYLRAPDVTVSEKSLSHKPVLP
ncbi:MAG: tRNA threonylcarbamoyl adenosine modification protein YeaZ [Pontimonas sp.]